MDFLIPSFIIIICSCLGRVQNNVSRLNTTSDDSISAKATVFLNSLQLLAFYNYTSETHSVTTEDGHIVTLFRIPSKGPPVLLVHGIGDSSDSWLVLGPNDSLAYLLADAGFDVWLYNARGNKYSRKHAGNITQKEYWDFSFEEMGSEDLPATIDYILQTTAQSRLFYIGFSQGTTVLFVMCSMKPEYCSKIHHAVLLAPVAWVNYLKYPAIEVLAQNLQQLSSFADHVGLYELFPSSSLLNLYHSEVCNNSSPLKVLCDKEFFLSYGLRDIKNLPPERLPVIASHIPAGSSTKTFLHFIQGYSTKGFKRYDYLDRGRNLRAYGFDTPPEYDVSLVNVPITMISSPVDWFSTPLDVKILRSKLPNIVSAVVLNKQLGFTHLEFVYGTRVRTLINDPLINLLRHYLD